MDQISVIFPFYGNFDIERPKIVLESIKNQRGINLEIVISEMSENPLLKDVIGNKLIRSVYPPVTDETRDGIFRPGKIRNTAAKISRGDFIYSTDGDVVLANPNYLHDLVELMKENENTPFYRPPMRRLPLECFEDFKKMVSEKGIEESLIALDTSVKFIANTPGRKALIKSITYLDKDKNEKTVLYTDSDWEKYKSDPSNKGKEPLFSTMTIHGGGTIFTPKQFEDVGGYSQEFINWGQDDSDLQWKLKSVFGISRVPDYPGFEVLHLDHPRGYFNRPQWRRNLEVQERRRSQNINDVLQKDREDYMRLK